MAASRLLAGDAAKLPTITISPALFPRSRAVSEEIELTTSNPLFDDSLSFKSNTHLLQRHDSKLSLGSRTPDNGIRHVTNDSWVRGAFLRGAGRTSQDHDNAWSQSYLRAGPLSGLCALAFILLSIPVSAILLAVSNGQAVETWKVQPSVFISVITGVGNKAMGFAAIQGAVVTWWVRAARGTTYEALHYDWPVGTDIWGSLSTRHISKLTLTAICGCIIFLDGILLQSATATTERSLNDPVLLHALLTPEIPTNYTGEGSLSFQADDALHAKLSAAMTPIYENWIEHAAIPSPVDGCVGICKVKLKAPALEMVECKIRVSMPMNLTSMSLSNGTVLSPCSFQYGKVRCPSFDVQTQAAARPGTEETIVAGFGSFQPTIMQGGQHCAGNYTYRACWLRPIIAEYDTKTYNYSYIQIDSRHPKRISAVNNTARAPYQLQKTINATIGGIALLASMDNYTSIGLWNPNETYRYIDNVNTFHAKLMTNTERYDSGLDCAPMWKDPLDDLISTMNNLLFRTAVFATKNMAESEILARIDDGLNVSYSIEGIRVDDRPVFYTRWTYFWAATGVQLICVIFVLTTYRDYWKLGRSTSLSPLEIAKAFDAPAFRHLPENLRSWQLAEKLGNEKIRYGQVVAAEGNDDHRSHRLMFDVPERVSSPGRGNTFRQ